MPNLIDQHIRIPRYLTVAEELRTQIVEGRYKPGDRLPSYNEMKAQFEADQRTVEKTHALLEEEGLIQRVPGRGAFVADPARRSSTGFVGCLDNLRGRNLPFYMAIQVGARDACSEAGRSLAMVDDPREFSLWDSVDGLLVCDMGLYSRRGQLDGVLRPGMPQVHLFYEAEGCSSVVSDDRQGIAEAMEHLFELGHRRIGYLGTNIDIDPYLAERYQCYQGKLQQRGVEPEAGWTRIRTNPDDFNYREHGYLTMRGWLEQGWADLRLTAMLVQNDHMARGMMHALHEAGISVPGDVSVVGFDGADVAQFLPLSLTTVNLPLREMGNIAMKLLLDHIDKPETECRNHRVPVQLHVGHTTAAAKEG